MPELRHPGEDVRDGITFEMLLGRVGNHPRCNILYDPSHVLLQQLDYRAFIDQYKDRIKMFHVKDAEFNPSAKQGIYSGFQPWLDRAARFRSLGDGGTDAAANLRMPGVHAEAAEWYKRSLILTPFMGSISRTFGRRWAGA